MKISSFAVKSLLFSVVGIVTISPQFSYSKAVSVQLSEPKALLETLATSTEVSATSLPAIAAIPARVSQAAPVRTLAAERIDAAPIEQAATRSVPSFPTMLSIPSIGLDSRVVPMGMNTKGELDVPSGSTSNIGWYKDGVIPGEMGSAVMDAHVFAGFSRLHSVSVGDSVYVTGENGSTQHFIVTAVHTYALSELTSDMLFQNTDGHHLNLITCAGSLTPSHATYDHRLIVYTELGK